MISKGNTVIHTTFDLEVIKSSNQYLRTFSLRLEFNGLAKHTATPVIAAT